MNFSKNASSIFCTTKRIGGPDTSWRPFMEAEDVLNLFDSFWFNQEILKKNSKKPTSSTPCESHDQKIQNYSSKPEISSQLTIHTRSKSEQLTSFKTSLNSESFSPDSVLYRPHLQKIVSGKEASTEVPRTLQLRKIRGEKRETKKGLSKSLSELEFEELKGFMDLGFVFSEEDKDSSLVEIIPGLQRLGKKKDGEEEESSKDADKCSITRPYLSEAWEVLKRSKREKNPLTNWRVPSASNEIEMKDSLKWWAHTVASTVR